MKCGEKYKRNFKLYSNNMQGIKQRVNSSKLRQMSWKIVVNIMNSDSKTKVKF